MRDFQRTVAFLRGADRAIRSLLASQAGRPVRVLYAGCGPFAPLLVPLLHRFGSGDLQVHLLDIHERSLSICRDLIARLDLDAYVAEFIKEDASIYRHGDRPPFQLLITEVMQAALEHECQVAVAANLAGQLDPEGLMIPERVTLTAVMLDPGREFSIEGGREEERVPLGCAFQLDRETAESIGRGLGEGPDHARWVPAAELRVASGPLSPADLWILTEIGIFEGIRIVPHESGLTIPRPAPSSDRLRGGDLLRFGYRIGADPGLTLDIERHRNGVAGVS